MNRNSIRWRLPISYGVIALVAALSLGSVMLLVLRSYYARQEQDYLLGNALALQPVIARIMESKQQEGLLQDQIDGLAFLSQTQIRVLGTNGLIIADSGVPHPNQVVAVAGASKREIPYIGPADLPEEKIPFVIYSNKSQDIPQMIPFNESLDSSSPATGKEMILSVSASPYGYGFVAASPPDPTRRSPYVANIALIASDGRKLGELEISNGPSYGADVIDSVSLAWLIASVFALSIAALTGWLMSKRVTRPVLALENATRQMEQGDLSVRVELKNERQQEFLSLAHTFNGMAVQVEQTVSALRAFVADAAHELHTPLTALHTNLELATDEKTASRRTLFLARAQQQSQRLEALVNGMLDLSRLEAGQSIEPKGRINLSSLLQELAESFASRAEQIDRIFQLSLPEDSVFIEGNALQIQRAVQNLLENALKFTDKGDTINLSLRIGEGEALLLVTDTGIGIPPDDGPRLFGRFHRGHNASSLPGSGLGLAIVRAIIESHRGHVEAKSDGVGQGSSFSIRLPIAK